MTEANQNRQPSEPERRASRQVSSAGPTRQRQLAVWIGGAAGLALLLIVGLALISNGDNRSINQSEAAAMNDDTSVGASATPGSAATPAMFEGVQTDGRFLGNPDAPVHFVVYSDFQCPFCKQFDDRDLPPIIENFVQSGDVRVEWRPLPIISSFEDIPLESSENESVQAAEAAMCAAEQDRFWAYSDALFAAQGAENSGIYSNDMLRQTAEELGLDTDAFNDCLASGEKQADVIEFREDAIERGITGTPTFLINDQLVSYTRAGYERLEQQLNAALAGDPVEN